MFEREAYYQLLVQTAPDGIILSDLNGAIRIANAAAASLYGARSGDELVGTTVLDLVNEGDQHALRESIEEAVHTGYTQHIECPVRRGIERSIVELAISVTTTEDGTPMGFMTVARDITKHKLREEQLHTLALHDPLTGLPNRDLFHDRLAQAIEGARRTNTEVSVFYIDLDYFKAVNDRFGHAVADALLQEMARRMQENMRASDTLGRLGGDEFAAVLPFTDVRGAKVMAAKLKEEVVTSFQLMGNAITIGVSIGIAVYPTHGDNALAIIRQADVAMYAEKGRARGNAVEYGLGADARAARRPPTFIPDEFATPVDPRVLTLALAHAKSARRLVGNDAQ